MKKALLLHRASRLSLDADLLVSLTQHCVNGVHVNIKHGLGRANQSLKGGLVRLAKAQGCANQLNQPGEDRFLADLNVVEIGLHILVGQAPGQQLIWVLKHVVHALVVFLHHWRQGASFNVSIEAAHHRVEQLRHLLFQRVCAGHKHELRTGCNVQQLMQDGVVLDAGWVARLVIHHRSAVQCHADLRALVILAPLKLRNAASATQHARTC